MVSHPIIGPFGIFLEAEVAPKSQSRFEGRYHKASGVLVTPGSPVEYQTQPNKWGSELRVYFNDPGLAASLDVSGVHVEFPRAGYKAGEYKFRANKNNLWWELVEKHGLRLGLN